MSQAILKPKPSNAYPEKHVDPPFKRPLRYLVVVRVAPAEKKIGSIIVPEATQDRRGFEITRGWVTALAPKAFSDAEQWPAGSDTPKVGDAVYFKKYAGAQLEVGPASDQTAFRVMEDSEIVGFWDE